MGNIRGDQRHISTQRGLREALDHTWEAYGQQTLFALTAAAPQARILGRRREGATLEDAVALEAWRAARQDRVVAREVVARLAGTVGAEDSPGALACAMERHLEGVPLIPALLGHTGAAFLREVDPSDLRGLELAFRVALDGHHARVDAGRASGALRAEHLRLLDAVRLAPRQRDKLVREVRRRLAKSCSPDSLEFTRPLPESRSLSTALPAISPPAGPLA